MRLPDHDDARRLVEEMEDGLIRLGGRRRDQITVKRSTVIRIEPNDHRAIRYLLDLLEAEDERSS